MERVAEYLQQIFGINIYWKPWLGIKQLPHFLNSTYSFYEMETLNSRFLILQDKNKESQTPANIDKHVIAIQKYWHEGFIYSCDSMDRFTRRRLIEKKIAFIAPFNQAYIPELAMDLREYNKTSRIRNGEFKPLSPIAQVVFLHTLISSDTRITTSNLGQILKYTRMSLNRAFDELSDAGLVNVELNNTHKVLSLLHNKFDSWTNAQNALWSPVRKREYITLKNDLSLHGLHISGTKALESYSNIADERLLYAVGQQEWNVLKIKFEITPIKYRAPNSVEIEIWRYNPAILCKDNRVDPLSLFLSLRDSKDERIETALETMIRKFLNART